MLRKDSERRATLHRVLTDYISNVVSNIQESVPQVGKVNPTCQLVSISKVLALYEPYISGSPSSLMLLNPKLYEQLSYGLTVSLL